MDRGEERRELRGQRERAGEEVDMSLERDGGEERETRQRGTTGEEMKGIHHPYVKRDTMTEEERRGEKRTGSEIRIEEERTILIEVGRERGVQIKRKKKKGGVLLRHWGVIGLPLLGHTEVSSSNLQRMKAEVRRYGILLFVVVNLCSHLLDEIYLL